LIATTRISCAAIWRLVEAIARAKGTGISRFGHGKISADRRHGVASEAYDVHVQKYLLKVPLPTVEGSAVLEELASRNPRPEADPRKFFDDSFVRQLQSSGFIDGLYR
jgi:hypothetical protein